MKIVSIGAVLMDQIALVERFPGEDDEVFIPRMQLMPGGSAANFAVFCSRLGAETGFVGRVGNDGVGDQLIIDLQREHVNTDTASQSALPTGTAFIGVRPDGQRMIFAYSGAANDLRESNIDLDYLNGFDHLHLADLKNISALKYAAEKFDGTVSLNPGALIAERRDDAFDLIKHVDILICSEAEAKSISGEQTVDECLRAGADLGPKIVVITRGPEYPKAFDGKNILTAPTHDIKVVDATGAGDSFSSGFITEYLGTGDIYKSLRFAIAVSEIVIQHDGARGGLKDRAQVQATIQ